MQSDLLQPGMHQSHRLDNWYAALDGRQLQCGTKVWQVQVAGIHGAGDDYWIQTTLVGEPAMALMLRVSPGTTIGKAMQTLEGAAAQGQGECRVLCVRDAA